MNREDIISCLRHINDAVDILDKALSDEETDISDQDLFKMMSVIKYLDASCEMLKDKIS